MGRFEQHDELWNDIGEKKQHERAHHAEDDGRIKTGLADVSDDLDAGEFHGGCAKTGKILEDRIILPKDEFAFKLGA